MSCFPELRYALYADDELSPDERHAVEAHLITCRACRELVVQLTDETELLDEVLQERARGRAPGVTRAPIRGVAVGMGPSLLAAAAVIAALGWIFETLTPMAGRWLGPFSVRGAYDMVFDLIFLLRDRAPELLSVGIAVAAMASASALLTFLLTALLRRWPDAGLMALGVLLALVLAPAEGRAHFGLHEHDDYELAAGDVHDGTLFVSAEEANINGTVEGDLFVFSRSVTIRGEVHGNVVAVARNFEQPGRVDGSLHVAAARAHLAGTVEGNFYAFADDLTIARSARIGRDASFAAERGVLEGGIGRDLFAGGDRIELRGAVARNVRAWTERLDVLDGASVKGDIAAWLPPGDEVHVADGARVEGEVTSSVRLRDRAKRFAGLLEPMFYVLLVLHIAAGFAAAMLLRALLPAAFEGRIETAGAFFRTLGMGFLVMVAAPIALVLTGLTLVGLPVALIAGAFYLSAVYVGLLLVSFLVGSALVHPGATWTSFGLSLLAGLALVALATHLPVVGGVFLVVVLLIGTGLVAERCLAAWRARPSAQASA